MSDTYGAPTIPLPVPIALPSAQAPDPSQTEVTDPAVSMVAQFAKAMLNGYAQTAYASVCPPVTGLASGTGTLAKPACNAALWDEPSQESFNEADLPAVYVFRNGGDRPYWWTEDWRVSEDTWTLLYIFKPAPQATRSLVKGFANGVFKLLDAKIETVRDPAYIASWDTDPKAGTTAAAPAAIKLPVASSTSPQIYTGGALDGPVGTRSFAPAQLPTITVTGAPCSGVAEVVGTGADGNPRVSRITLSGTGTFAGDWTLSAITEIDAPAQASTASTLSFGLFGFAGLGTDLLALGGFDRFEVTKWRQFPWKLPMQDGSSARTYPHAVEITLFVRERWTRDISGAAANQVDTQYPVTGTSNADPLRGESFFS